MTVTAELMSAGDGAEWWAPYTAPLWAPIAMGDALRRIDGLLERRPSESAVRGVLPGRLPWCPFCCVIASA